MKKKITDRKLEWYVLNGDINKQKVAMWNIFNNHTLNDAINEVIDKYHADELTYEQFKEEVSHLIGWQEWGRCEYEIYATQHPYYEEKYLCKINCYEQAVANLEPLCQYLIHC